MLLPFYLGLQHALEPDHVAVVTGVSMGQRKGAWKVGVAFGISHMLAVAVLAAITALLGAALLGDRFYDWMDKAAWAFVVLLGLWNLAAAFGWRKVALHTHVHRHGALEHEHPHAEKITHRFHHSAAWLGAFFGLGGVRGFATLMHDTHLHGWTAFSIALLFFGLGITLMFLLLSAISGWLSQKLGTTDRLHRGLYLLSGIGNVAVGLWLLIRA